MESPRARGENIGVRHRLELGYGFRKNELAVYGEGQITHVNAGGQGISAVEDNWTWAPGITLGLRFRWYK